MMWGTSEEGGTLIYEQQQQGRKDVVVVVSTFFFMAPVAGIFSSGPLPAVVAAPAALITAAVLGWRGLSWM